VTFLLFFIAYAVLVLAAGLLFRRRMRDLADFFLAGRSLSAGLIFVSLTASWFGATSILVTTEEAFRTGVRAVWIVGAPAVLTVLVLAVFLAGPLRRLPIMTIPDLVELKYGRTVRHLASALIVWYMIMLAASQMVALGRFLEGFLGWSYLGCLALGTVVVLAYSVAGGLRSVVFTDIIQFALLVAGIAGLVIFLGGRSSPGDVERAIQASGRDGYLSLFSDFGASALTTLSFTLAWIISPIALQRIRAGRDDRAARTGLLATAGALTALYAGVVLAGILALPLFGEAAPSETLLTAIIRTKAGMLLGGLLYTAVLAALLSTMDTAINTGALSLTRDVVEQVRPRAAQKPVLVSRWATVAVGCAAFIAATGFRSILQTIGLASEIMAEGLFIPGMAMIFMKRRAPLAGLLSLVLGGGFSVLSFLSSLGALPFRLPAWPRSVPCGLALSAGGFVFGLFFCCKLRKRPTLTREPARRL
jgi:SSS family solute:Na+ symporter